MSSYRPNYGAPPPPPPRDLPPLPYGPPPTGPPPTARYGESNHSRNPPRGPLPSFPQSDFSFRIEGSAPRYPPNKDTYRPPPNSQNSSNNNFQRDAKGPRRGQRPPRGRGPKIMPSARPLLQLRGGDQDRKEQSLGVDLDMQKFLPINDILESDDDQHNESTSDSEENKNNSTKVNGEGEEPPAKRREFGSSGLIDGDSVPKWSNPDPYSVLPPVEDVHQKRKDPVAFIRKGLKPTEEKANTTHNQVAANEDFISFEDDVRQTSASSSKSPPESRASPDRTVLDISDHEQLPDLTADDESLLGSRKRTLDDNIKPGTRPKKSVPAQPSGSLLEAWIPPRISDATPWLSKETSSIMNPGFRLHREVCDFFEFVKPQHHEHQVRQALLSRLQNLIARELPDCTVHCFGSFAAGLYLPNADMDISINSKMFDTRGEKDGSVDVIAGAKVPIVKFVDRLTALKVDVSFENNTGMVANNTFSAWKRQYPAVPVLVAIIKQFLMMRGLNEVQFGGLGGFSVTCLVVSLLQNMPRVQTQSLIAEENLGEILIEFLDFYGNRIDIERTGISMNPPGYFDKQALNRFKGSVYNSQGVAKLVILDPNRPDNDISGGSKRVTLIFERFARAHVELVSAMKSQDRPSMLDWMLGGNYESFAWHRDRLLNVYDNESAESHGLDPPSTQQPNDQLLIDMQARPTTQALSSMSALTARQIIPDTHPTAVRQPPINEHGDMENTSKVILAEHPGNSRPMRFEEWTEKFRLRTIGNPAPSAASYPAPNIGPLKSNNPGLEDRSRQVSTKMVPPSDERRKEVTRHFSGYSPNYPIDVD